MNQLSYIVEVATLSASGTPVVFEPDSADLEKLANSLQAIEVQGFKSDLRIARWKKFGVQFSGTATLEVTQSCVVTLDPVKQDLKLEVCRRFMPAGKVVRHNEYYDDGELVIDPEGQDEPDELNDNQIDLWQILIEEILLELDPFPRSATASSGNHEVEASSSSTSPENFAESGLEPVHKPFSDLNKLINQKKSEN